MIAHNKNHCVHYTGPPGTPINIRFSHITSTSFVVHWDEVDDADQYLVNWRIGDGGKAREATTTQTSHTITGLTPNTTYYMIVIAINRCGQSGTGSDVFIVTTDLWNTIKPSSSISTMSTSNIMKQSILSSLCIPAQSIRMKGIVCNHTYMQCTI